MSFINANITNQKNRDGTEEIEGGDLFFPNAPNH
jgi:hypothetical protein